jgi:hypothetical protein
MAHKTIVWKSWNATVDEIIGSIEEEMEAIQNELNNINEEGGIDGNGQNWLMPMFDKQALNLIHTPWGPYPLDSTFKPSDRWDCRIGRGCRSSKNYGSIYLCDRNSLYF